jgi:hypothetical protein
VEAVQVGLLDFDRQLVVINHLAPSLPGNASS